MNRPHHVIAVALVALAAALSCGTVAGQLGIVNGPGNTSGPQASQVAGWPARDVAPLADPGQPLGVGVQQSPEPAALVVPPVDFALPAVTGPQSLDDCVAIAMQNHPRITAARAEIRVAQGKAVQARLYPNPVIAGFTP